MRRKPPNRSILIQNTILKFTKSKNEIKKCPIKVPKTKNLFKRGLLRREKGDKKPPLQALCRSEKEGDCRPPEPSCSNQLYSFL